MDIIELINKYSTEMINEMGPSNKEIAQVAQLNISVLNSLLNNAEFRDGGWPEELQDELVNAYEKLTQVYNGMHLI